MVGGARDRLAPHDAGEGGEGVHGGAHREVGRAVADGELILVGNPALLEQFGIDSPDAARVAGELADGGTTPMIVAAGGRALAGSRRTRRWKRARSPS